MRTCAKPGCGAPVGADGYCTRCGTAARSAPPERAAAAREQPPDRLPEAPEPPGDGRPLPPLLADPQVPEHERFCVNPECRSPVGRSRHDRPGLVTGFCPRCGTAFSFRPPLEPGTKVGDGQFRVEGAIGHGGLGWIYRAWDRWASRRVVLKGLIDPDDPDGRSAAARELNALTHASHPHIVNVLTVVKHPHPRTGHDVDYIVMEYLRGRSLRELQRERPADDPYFPIDQVCEIAIKVLAALEHLHDRLGLLYCDLSTDNVIRVDDDPHDIKLIDLGAVCRIDDQAGPLWGKKGFQDPEIVEHRPSVGTDLYTVGRLIAALGFPVPGFLKGKPIPGPDEVRLLAEYSSLDGLLRRATHPDPKRRFASAAEMAEQLRGVLREIRAAQGGGPFRAESTLFGPERQVAGAEPEGFPFADPDPVAAALALPAPQVDRADPNARLLAAMTEDPDEIERVLETLPAPSLETRLRGVRARIEAGRADADAEDGLDEVDRAQPGGWRIDWYRGLSSLVRGDLAAARSAFTEVHAALPGEAAPKLALALCAAQDGAPEVAERHYATVWRTDRSYVSAAFGLARARCVLGDVAGAAATLESVPQASRYGVTARLCAVLCRVRAEAGGHLPTGDFFTAAEWLSTVEMDEQRRAQAVAEVLEAVLRWQRAGRPWPHGPDAPVPPTLFGKRLDERGVRDGLEAAYRTLARHAPDRAERIELVDKANRCRNRSWL